MDGVIVVVVDDIDGDGDVDATFDATARLSGGSTSNALGAGQRLTARTITSSLVAQPWCARPLDVTLKKTI